MVSEQMNPDQATVKVPDYEVLGDWAPIDDDDEDEDDELPYTFDVDGKYIAETIDHWMEKSFPQILQAATVSVSQLPELVGRTKESAETLPNGLHERTGRAELNRQENIDILRRCAPNCIVTELQPNIQDGLGARYQIEYQLSDHPVVAVVEELPQAGFIETTFSRKHFAVLHWLISRSESADTEYVDAVQLCPKVASTVLSVSIKQIDANPRDYYSEQNKMIVISSLSFRGL